MISYPHGSQLVVEMKNKDKENEETLPNTSRSKKAYQQPQLQVYGDLKAITQGVGMTGTMDGGTGQTDKTRP
jgi:hypothetical protein